MRAPSARHRNSLAATSVDVTLRSVLAVIAAATGAQELSIGPANLPPSKRSTRKTDNAFFLRTPYRTGNGWAALRRAWTEYPAIRGSRDCRRTPGVWPTSSVPGFGPLGSETEVRKQKNDGEDSRREAALRARPVRRPGCS
jgi:hypothetical protein